MLHGSEHQRAEHGAPTDGGLTNEHLAAYRRDGFVLVRRVFDPDELGALRAGILDAFERHRPAADAITRPKTAYERAFVQVVNMGLACEAVRALTWSPRLGRMATELMGVEGARIFVEDAMFKEPGAGHTPWHQDASCLPLLPRHMVTAWIPLVAVGPESGRLRFVAGSHELGLLGPVDISEETDELFERVIAERQLPIVELPAMEPGDVSFHAGTTIHGALANTTAHTRELIAVHYFSDGARIGPLDNPTRRSMVHHLTPHLAPGDLADAPAWPLVYRRAPDDL